jgi:hypothetical protein
VNIWLSDYSGPLHRLTKVGRSDKRLRLLEVVGCKKQHNLIRVINSAQKMFLG